jgi:hypothetical protein
MTVAMRRPTFLARQLRRFCPDRQPASVARDGYYGRFRPSKTLPQSPARFEISRPTTRTPVPASGPAARPTVLASLPNVKSA